MEDINKLMDEWRFTEKDDLKLHQLQAKKEWSEKKARESPTSAKKEPENEQLRPKAAIWSLSDSVILYDWQKNCIENWFKAAGKGTVKVVTGAGKTILALAILQRLQNQKEQNLHVAIVVPTIVLMDQWYEEINEKTNIPPELIGRLGGGYTDDFEKGCKILLCVINSAQEKLPKMVDACGCKDDLLLIVDECHRAGASVMSNVLKTERKYSLGLSATPERENDAWSFDEDECADNSCQIDNLENYDESLLGKELGQIIYEMTLDDAFKIGILPPYEIHHYGIPLSLNERQRYDRITKEIKDIKDKLWKLAFSQNIFSDRDFNRWCNMYSDNGEASKAKRLYLSKIRERKSLLYKADSRREAVVALLNKEFLKNPDAQAILFHENIDEAMNLWAEFDKTNIDAVPENSKLSDNTRKNSIRLFRQGTAKVLVSVRSLIEGFNVPSADIGIVVASSTSARQRIQTLGRLLRKHKTKTGEEKHSTIYVLYIEKTVDEIIYEKTDWDTLTGAERNIYFKWNPASGIEQEPERQDGPPRTPLLSDIQIDASNLVPGDKYPGKYEGLEYSADSEGNIYSGGQKERPVANPQEVPHLLYKFKNAYGKFRVTPKKNFVLAQVFRDNEWVTSYITVLEKPFHLADFEQKNYLNQDISSFQSGDEIKGLSLIDAVEYGYKRKSGREFIVKKIKRGEIYAHTSENANDKVSGKQAEDLLYALSLTEKKIGDRINKFKITTNNIALTLKNGKAVFISRLQNPLEFNEMN